MESREDVVRVGKNVMIVTSWYVEHNHEPGLIFLNDWALGAHFGSRAGFEARLKEQGFTVVRNITPEELDAIKKSANGKLASCGGPWLPKYPWEESGAPASPAKKMEKPVVFRFTGGLKKEAKAIMDHGYFAKAIAKAKDALGECFGYEVRLAKGEKGDLDFNIYPMTKETFNEFGAQGTNAATFGMDSEGADL